jgi:hypothetical protein
MNVATADVRCHELINEIYCTPKVGVEIGVFRGALSWRLLGSNRNLFLYMVDPWSESTGDDSYAASGDEYAKFSQDEFDGHMAKALEEVAPFKGQYEVLRMTSAEAAPRFTANSLDFVFIDGDHSYEGCKQDIDLWFPKLRNGGILSGHDYRTDKGYGVIQAVDEFVAGCGRSLRRGGNHTWFVTK